MCTNEFLLRLPKDYFDHTALKVYAVVNLTARLRIATPFSLVTEKKVFGKRRADKPINQSHCVKARYIFLPFYIRCSNLPLIKDFGLLL